MRTRLLLIVIMVLALGTLGSSCNENRREEGRLQEKVHQNLREQVPVPEIDGAAARAAIRGHLERWQNPDVVSFVTVFATTGNPIGYYEASGKVASTCQMMTAPDEIDNGHVVDAPALDGTYYTDTECGVFFFTAQGDTYVELSPEMHYIITDQPLPIDVEPLEVSTGGE